MGARSSPRRDASPAPPGAPARPCGRHRRCYELLEPATGGGDGLTKAWMTQSEGRTVLTALESPLRSALSVLSLIGTVWQERLLWLISVAKLLDWPEHHCRSCRQEPLVIADDGLGTHLCVPNGDVPTDGKLIEWDVM
jgi:hypothetical protein